MLINDDFAALLATLGMQAQTIKKGDAFFDGNSLYTVQEVRMGKYVYMTTPQDNEMTLEKVEGKNGEYKIIPSRQADECPIRFTGEFNPASAVCVAKMVCISWLFAKRTVTQCGP